jgi:hypothetical protein
MTLAIMQPYFLPYIGYFQLMCAADKFVVFDDVNYINRGWINRNRLLDRDEPRLFTLPLRGASQNRLICDLELVDKDEWHSQLCATVQRCYAKAPGFELAFDLFRRITKCPSSNLSEFLTRSLRLVADALGIDTVIEPTSRRYQNAELKGASRLIDICRQEGADSYLNAPGGRGLYVSETFEKAGLKLRFLDPKPSPYKQYDAEFTPSLSILDTLMFNPMLRVKQMLAECSIEESG